MGCGAMRCGAVRFVLVRLQLSSDVFSMAFLPEAAPGAGHAFVCGCRDGSVVLVDPRQPPRHNATATVASGLARRGSGSSGGGSGSWSSSSGSEKLRRAQLGGPRRAGGGRDGRSPAAELLVRLDLSSVDHTHVLRDGTRCLVKGRSGGLQVVDLRVFAGQAQGQGRPRALKVLVPPRGGQYRAPAPARFALDPTETVVLTPVAGAATAAACVGGNGGGGGGGAGTAGGAWGAFSSSSTGDANGGFTAGGGSTGYAGPRGDRLRILNVSSGEVLNDIQTPWTGMSLARGAGTAADPDFCGMRFWGTAWEAGRGAAVFEARLRSETEGGYGRI